MLVKDATYYKRIIRNIYLYLPYTLFKQHFFYRFRKPKSTLPDFLCIGTQRSGTTWLYRQLMQHPDIFVTEPKEVHYFDWFFHRSLRWYSSFFKSDKLIKGELTPGYSIIDKGRIRFIRRIMPDAKLILLLRDPRERAWSSARYHLEKQRNDDLHTVSVEEYIAHFKIRWVQQRGDYEKIWKSWSAVFPPSQILVIFTEELEQQPQEVFDRISRYLGVSVGFRLDSPSQKHNASQSVVMPREVKEYLDQQYSSMIETMPQWLGRKDNYWNFK